MISFIESFILKSFFIRKERDDHKDKNFSFIRTTTLKILIPTHNMFDNFINDNEMCHYTSTSIVLDIL